ncbi:MAG: LOG family protein, partial [Bacteroidota bacterium]
MNICVFCGSGSGNDPVFIEAARELGTHMAKEGLGLVYGGADIGLMGAIADAVLAGGGTVIGIIPSFL